MVSIDTVYQKVLALANKEQRGYITPQDFNLFANQAQMEIFEQYFYDINKGNKASGNNTEYSDVLSLLEEKIRLFEVERGNNWAIANMTVVSGYITIPEVIYRLGDVRIGSNQVEMLTSKKFDAARFSPLTAPTLTRPIGYAISRGLTISVGLGISVTPTSHPINLSYIKKPEKVNWTYVVINKQAMYDANPSTQDFELHPSEENQLVNKILKLAGISNEQPDITRAGAGMDQLTTQQQPKI